MRMYRTSKRVRTRWERVRDVPVRRICSLLRDGRERLEAADTVLGRRV